MQRALAGFAALCLLGVLLAAAAPIDASPSVARSAAPLVGGGHVAAPLRAAQPTAYIDGLDDSDHQKSIDWEAVAASGKQDAFIRATAGTRTADRTYAANVAGAGAAGLSIGSYHFANPTTAPGDAEAEAAWFLAHATIGAGDLVPVLDLERANGLKPVELIAWAQTWLETVTEATGVRPMIYAAPVFWWKAMANTDWFAQNGYPLWIAHWTPASPILPAGDWNDRGWTVWQHTSHGAVSGITGRVDLDRIAGGSLPASLFVP
jgi:GH25 family lysozyme M1 (1,4-beta-N-acetylmuramidase)